jgi:hypothetical protein
MTADPQTAPSDAAKLWSGLRWHLSNTMTRATFDHLLRGSEGIKLEGHNLTVEVRGPLALPWLNERWMPTILRVAHIIVDPDLEIVFVARELDTYRDSGHGDAEPAGPEAGDPEPDDPEPGDPEPGDPAPGNPGADRAVIEAAREQHVLPGAERELVWTDYYIKLKVAFRKSALRTLKGAPLSVFICLALHMNQDGKAYPGIEAIMRETGYARPSICAALDELESLRLISKRAGRHGAGEYTLHGYAWLGKTPAPALYEMQERKAGGRNLESELSPARSSQEFKN